MYFHSVKINLYSKRNIFVIQLFFHPIKTFFLSYEFFIPYFPSDHFWSSIFIYKSQNFNFQYINCTATHCKGWVTYRFSYAIRQNGARGWGAVTNDVFKFRKFIEFENSCIVICFPYNYLIIEGKRSFIN